MVKEGVSLIHCGHRKFGFNSAKKVNQIIDKFENVYIWRVCKITKTVYKI